MSEANSIWRLGRWLANEGTGAVELSWGGGTAVLHVVKGQLVGLEGLDPGCVGAAVAQEPAGKTELFAEAMAVAQRSGIPPTRALTAVKRCLERALEAWILDPERRVVTREELRPAPDGPAISLAHVMVELLLAGDDPVLAERVLPDDQVLLRRGPDFLERYARLQLSEEADLIAAKITGTRTAAELLARSPHPREEVLRLLAALTASGLLEPVPVATPEPAEPTFQPTPRAAPLEPARAVRRLPWKWIAAAAAVLLVLLLGLTLALRHRRAPRAASSGMWGVVVDMGCEAVDYERMLRKVRKHPKDLRAVKTRDGGEGPCWRLVWGEYPSKGRALEALPRIPQDAVADGFSPHVVEIQPTAGGDAP